LKSFRPNHGDNLRRSEGVEVLNRISFVLAGPIALAAMNIVMHLSTAIAEEKLPGSFVYLRDVDPSILQDIRYAGAENFTGHKLPGYEAGECVLKRTVALALARVQADLKLDGLSLKVYDCYRPARAVAAMVSWVESSGNATKHYYPRLPKSKLLSLGYIAARSGHSLGTAVDVTIVAMKRDEATPSPIVADTSREAGPCTAPVGERASDNSVDMGTAFDCFDDKSHVDASGLTIYQRAWRRQLKAVMSRHGFRDYFREWWHFSFGEAFDTYMDFPILPRAEAPAQGAPWTDAPADR
jgi:zinc D-Ala-D-Ala dipeptidase